MRVNLKWFLTGKVTPIEEPDDLLNPDSTLAELKGFIQIRFGFSAKEILLTQDHLLENAVTLKSLGITGQPNDPVLTAHVVREVELEASNLGQDDTTNDDALQEFSHADFILAMKMLGKDVPVPDARIVEMRERAPRQRPAFLNAAPIPGARGGAASNSSAPPPGMPGFSGGGNVQVYNPKNTRVYQIFQYVEYGLRKEGVDGEFAIVYPGFEPFAFWDMRTPDPFESSLDHLCEPGEVCLELFYFGEFAAIKDDTDFRALVRQSLESKVGVRLRTPAPVREAGCMYPLVAVPVVLHEMDAQELGDRFFEEFGTCKGVVPPQRGANDGAVAGGGGCAPQ